MTKKAFIESFKYAFNNKISPEQLDRLNEIKKELYEVLDKPDTYNNEKDYKRAKKKLSAIRR